MTALSKENNKKKKSNVGKMHLNENVNHSYGDCMGSRHNANVFLPTSFSQSQRHIDEFQFLPIDMENMLQPTNLCDLSTANDLSMHNCTAPHKKPNKEVRNRDDALDIKKSIKKTSLPEIVNNSKEKETTDHSNSMSKYNLLKRDSHLKSMKGREWFLHSICHTCKNIPKSSVTCPKCQMITYCSEAHRREHWVYHREICEAIIYLCQKAGVTHVLQKGYMLSPEAFRTFRHNLAMDCQEYVKRQLEQWETEMFYHPNVCETCYESDRQKLSTCVKCFHVSYCSPKHEKETHKLWCEAYILYRTLVHQSKSGIVEPILPCTYTTIYCPLPEDMNSYMKTVYQGHNSLDVAQLSEMASVPLTVLYTMQTCLKKRLHQKCLTIHLIGAENDFEVVAPHKWEMFLLHHLPSLQKLTIVFIGPELKVNKKEEGRLNNTSSCSNCERDGKCLVFHFISGLLYHEYTKSSDFLEPNLICAFNAGLYRKTGYAEMDTWPKTIHSMFINPKTPVLVTAYTQFELKKDSERIKELINVKNVLSPCKNPFASLKPSLGFVNDEFEPIIYKNHYCFCMLKKLFGNIKRFAE